MANTEDFNRAVCTWPTTTGTLGSGLRDASWAHTAADVDLTVTTSASAVGRCGVPHKELSVTVLGPCTGVSRGDTGQLRVIFGATSDNAGIWRCGSTADGIRGYVASKTVSGSMDGEVTTSFTFLRYASSS